VTIFKSRACAWKRTTPGSCEEMSEVEGWYRLLQVDHAALQARMAQTGRRVTEPPGRGESLAVENQELQASSPDPSPTGPVSRATVMNKDKDKGKTRIRRGFLDETHL